MRRVAVVMPTRNMAGRIQSALDSVLMAKEVAEVIVVDDKSTDDTLARVRRNDDPRIRVLSSPPKGYPESMNTGFAAVSADFVVRCDADDFFVSDRLSAQIAWLDAHPEYVAASSAYATVDERGRQVARLAAEGEARDVTDILGYGKAVTHFCTFLTRIEAIRQIGGLRSWFQTGSDLDLQYRLAGFGKIWHDPSVQGYLYTLHDASITHRQSNARREFFDRCARDFALQRRETGQDDLMQGNPPALPDVVRAEEPTARSARHQIAGQLESAAWKAFRSGKKAEALGGMWRSVRRDPLSVQRWRGLGAMLVKRKTPGN